MSETLRRYSLQALAIVALFLAAAAVGYVTKDTGGGNSFGTARTDNAAGTRGAVQSLNGDTVVLLTESGQKSFTLASSTSVEVLRPSALAAISVGDWLNAGVTNNDQSVFTLIGLTLIPQAMLAGR